VTSVRIPFLFRTNLVMLKLRDAPPSICIVSLGCFYFLATGYMNAAVNVGVCSDLNSLKSL
jgi:hypothetical protein